MVTFWLIVAVASVIVEAITVQMVAIWFAPAALVAMLCAIPGAPLWLQIVVFFIVAALCFCFLYRRLRKSIDEKCEKTNLDAIIGLSVTVETAIPDDGCGRVLVKGISWQAVCPGGAQVGEKVRIQKIDGVTLACTRLAEQAHI